MTSKIQSNKKKITIRVATVRLKLNYDEISILRRVQAGRYSGYTGSGAFSRLVSLGLIDERQAKPTAKELKTATVAKAALVSWFKDRCTIDRVMEIVEGDYPGEFATAIRVVEHPGTTYVLTDLGKELIDRRKIIVTL
jgi:hypothetical protein